MKIVINGVEAEAGGGASGGVTMEDVEEAVSDKVSKSGDTMTGPLKVNSSISARGIIIQNTSNYSGIVLGNSGGNITIAPSINAVANPMVAILSGIYTPQHASDAANKEYVDSAVASVSTAVSEIPASNPNLLDNWYFADPVNQRGQTEYSGAWNNIQYSIDRWAVYTGTISVTGQGLQGATEQNIIHQYFEDPLYDALVGKQVTLSVLDSNGNFASNTGVVLDRSNNTFSIALSTLTSGIIANVYKWNGIKEGLLMVKIAIPEGAVVAAVKLELGDRQTLCRQDEDGNWVLNDPPPNKALEIIKCQRYYQRGSVYSPVIKHPSGAYYRASSLPLYNMLGKVTISIYQDNLFTTPGAKYISIAANGTAIETGMQVNGQNSVFYMNPSNITKSLSPYFLLPNGVTTVNAGDAINFFYEVSADL